ncbi:hypothetical protein ACFVT1_15335 [Streptomyces sp. NPDC057963]|uniref:hypothetical protein n=1 Tax=Streptomyces sp. NPDC057963 TaxID=3346290 RepID=UPI0036EE3E90
MPKKPALVIDSGSYSLSETSIAGMGQRLAEITQVLSSRFDVRVITPSDTDNVYLGEAETVAAGEDAERAVSTAQAVMFFDTPDRDRIELAASQRKLIIGECRAPIEHMDFPSLLADGDATGRHQRFVATYHRQLQVTHHFICRSQGERAALLSTLCALGRIRPADVARSRTLSHMISTVPIGFTENSLEVADAAVPHHMADFLWTGGIWALYEPLMLVEAVHILRERGVNASAAFLYAIPIEDTRSTIGEIRKRIDDLGLADRVLMNTTPLPLSERDRYVKAAQAYVCVAKPGAENETAVRLRLRDTWLHGIPTIIDPFGLSGDLVAREGLGIVLDQPDAHSLADAMQQVKSGGLDLPGRRMERLYEVTLSGFMDWLATELRTG